VPSVLPSDTPGLSPDRLAEVRALLDDAFAGTFTDDDWDHTLGGVHVVVTDEADRVVSHAAVVPRTITIGEEEFAAGYVEGVATAPTHRHAGLGTAAMEEVGGVIGSVFALGVLSTSSPGFYARLGWERWRGPSYVRDGEDMVRTEDEDDGIMVLRVGPSAAVDLTLPITCESRSGDDW
jgi:aminoglycoside 2'-N-acetyltransferase I